MIGTKMDHMNFIQQVATDDVVHLYEKEKTYKGSWKKRGGIGAFMMLARKWDRIEEIIKLYEYDIFKACNDMRGEDGTMIAEVRDLRRYLMLVEAEMLASKAGYQKENAHLTVKMHRRKYHAITDLWFVRWTLGDGAIPLHGRVTEQSDDKLYLKVKIDETVNGVWIIPSAGVETISRTDALPRIPRRDHVGGTSVHLEQNEKTGEIPAEDYSHAEFPMPRVPRPVDPLLPREPESHAVGPVHAPLCDSNKHADRAPLKMILTEMDMRASYLESDGTLKLVQPISAELSQKLSPKLQELFVVTGKHAIPDRRKFDDAERLARFRTMSLTVSVKEYGAMPNWQKELYEPRVGVETEMQLKEPYRLAWTS
jgi:hypothetical protein